MNGLKGSDLGAAIASELNRRQFIVAGGVIAAVTLPIAAVATTVPLGSTTAASVEQLRDWTIDDMWGVYPRYATPIGFGHSGTAPLERAGPVDAALAPY